MVYKEINMRKNSSSSNSLTESSKNDRWVLIKLKFTLDVCSKGVIKRRYLQSVSVALRWRESLPRTEAKATEMNKWTKIAKKKKRTFQSTANQIHSKSSTKFSHLTFIYICLGYLRHLGTIHEISGDIKQERCVAGLTVSMCNRPPCSREHPRHGPFCPFTGGCHNYMGGILSQAPKGRN